MTHKNYPSTSYLIIQQSPFYILTFLPFTCGALFMVQTYLCELPIDKVSSSFWRPWELSEILFKMACEMGDHERINRWWKISIRNWISLRFPFQMTFINVKMARNHFFCEFQWSFWCVCVSLEGSHIWADKLQIFHIQTLWHCVGNLFQPPHNSATPFMCHDSINTKINIGKMKIGKEELFVCASTSNAIVRLLNIFAVILRWVEKLLLYADDIFMAHSLTTANGNCEKYFIIFSQTLSIAFEISATFSTLSLVHTNLISFDVVCCCHHVIMSSRHSTHIYIYTLHGKRYKMRKVLQNLRRMSLFLLNGSDGENFNNIKSTLMMCACIHLGSWELQWKLSLKPLTFRKPMQKVIEFIQIQIISSRINSSNAN